MVLDHRAFHDMLIAIVASLMAPLVGDTTALGERMLVVYVTFAIAILHASPFASAAVLAGSAHLAAKLYSARGL